MFMAGRKMRTHTPKIANMCGVRGIEKSKLFHPLNRAAQKDGGVDESGVNAGPTQNRATEKWVKKHYVHAQHEYMYRISETIARYYESDSGLEVAAASGSCVAVFSYLP